MNSSAEIRHVAVLNPLKPPKLLERRVEVSIQRGRRREQAHRGYQAMHAPLTLAPSRKP